MEWVRSIAKLVSHFFELFPFFFVLLEKTLILLALLQHFLVSERFGWRLDLGFLFSILLRDQLSDVDVLQFRGKELLNEDEHLFLVNILFHVSNVDVSLEAGESVDEFILEVLTIVRQLKEFGHFHNKGVECLLVEETIILGVDRVPDLEEYRVEVFIEFLKRNILLLMRLVLVDFPTFNILHKLVIFQLVREDDRQLE